MYKEVYEYNCQYMSVSRIRMYPAKSLVVNSCAPWINPYLKVLLWEIVDRIIQIFTARSKLFLPFMAKCSNVRGWQYNMRYFSVYEEWKLRQIRKQAEHRLFTWFLFYHILKTKYFLSYYFLSYFEILRKSYHIFLSYFSFSNWLIIFFIIF